MCKVEVVTGRHNPVEPTVAFFDFDGTVGLIRAGWMEVMIQQALEALRATGTAESDDTLRTLIEEYVFRLTGKPTIYQMMELAENVRKRGGIALDPAVYKEQFLAELRDESDRRVHDIRAGEQPPDVHMVPGTRTVLEDLRRRGLRLYLVSGTDDALVQEEARLFDIARYFDGGVYGSPGDNSTFSKRGMIERVVAGGVRGEETLSFGDGHVELEAVKAVGGVAVGLATLEPECRQVDEWKRERLIESGADYIVPNYLCWNDLQEHLFGQ